MMDARVNFFAIQVKIGRITLNDVPEKLRAEVEKLLKK